MKLLGLDLGTTNVKALITDLDGQILSRGSAPVKLFPVGTGGVEQDIEEIWTATLQAIRQAVGALEPTEIQAIGVSSQGGAMQLLDAQDRPLGRVISWLDQRGRQADATLTAELGREWFCQRIHHGRSALAIGQLRRLRQEQPAYFQLPNRIGFVGDILVQRLCGWAAQDGTSAGLTLLYNPRLRNYDPDVLLLLRLRKSQLPDLLAPRIAAGGLRKEVARETGLRSGIPVSAAIHDQYAAALGSGAVRAGEVMVGTGTAWVLLAVMDQLTPPVIDDAFVCHHVVDSLCGQIVSLVNGGSAVNWALQLMGLGGKPKEMIDLLLAQANPGSDGLAFWPFLTPHGASGLAPDATGRLTGMQLSHTPAHVLRSVVESLVYELNRHLQFLRSAGLSVERLLVSGGAATSQVTPQIMADVTGLPLTCLASDEGSCLGAAVLACGLIEPHSSLETLSLRMAPLGRSILPGQQADFYQSGYQAYLRSLPIAS